ncbi:MAG: amine oxidase [Planctomycetaceae bacterium]|nr:amine oxidase [Planctomycetaceae bacterium]
MSAQTADFDAIIIGGGHNGLVCAGYLAKAGLRVVVLERRSFVGGATATEELFPGFRVSSCSYLCHILQAKIIDDFRLRDYGFEVYHLDPGRMQPYPDGRALLTWDSLEKTQASIARFSQRDADAFPRWMEFWQRAASLYYPYFLKSPPSMSQVMADAESRGEGEFLRRLLKVSMTELVSEYFEDEAIRGAFINAQDVGNPSAAGSAWCYAHIRSDLFSRPEDVGIVKGGMGSIANCLAASVQDLGVDIQVDSHVAEIVVRQGQVAGIRLVDGSEISSRLVISNADPKTTFLQLTDRSQLPDGFTDQVGGLKTNAGYLKFHMALSRLPDFSHYFHDDYDPRYLAYMKICPSVEYFAKSWRDAEQGRPPEQPVMEVQIPTVYDPTLTQSGQHVLSVWGLYAPVKLAQGTWDERRSEVAENLIEVLCQYATDLRDCIVDYSLLTPVDIERRVGMTDGNIRHLDMIPNQLLSERPLNGWSDYGTPIDGLYLCGAGTHPGGEVTGAPGHNAAEVILKSIPS